MKRSRLLPVLALLSGALFWGCFSDSTPSPTSPDTIEELQLKGSISGTVTDSVHHGISGVAVTLDSGGFATNTDSLGRYTIPNVPGRTWTIRFTKTNWADTSLPGVVLAIDEDRKGVNARMRWDPDTTVAIELDRAINGYVFPHLDSLAPNTRRIQAIALSLSGDTLAKQDMVWDWSGTFSGKLPLVGKSGILKALVRDSLDHITADTSIAFPASNIGIVLPYFAPNNAMPSVQVSGSFTSATSLSLHASGFDPHGGRIVRTEWSLDGTNWRTGPADTLHSVPSPVTSAFTVFARVTDNDGNQAIASKPFAPATGLVDSRDGQTYPFVTIGKQTWMARNLAYVTDSSWTYENNADSGAKYGRLYTWAAAMNLPDSCNLERNNAICTELIKPVHQGACPTKWHVPTPAEWSYLTDSVQKADSAATRLRAPSGWFLALPNQAGLDTYGFAALPGGSGNSDGFDKSGTFAWFRTTSPTVTLALYPFQATIQRFDVLATTIGYSLRCVKD